MLPSHAPLIFPQLFVVVPSSTAPLFSREKNVFRESGRSSMATTANGGTRISIDVATAVSQCTEYHLLVDVGLRRSSPSTEHLSPLIAARSHTSMHACTNRTHSGSSLLSSPVVFPSLFFLTSRSHLVTRGIRANEVPLFFLLSLSLHSFPLAPCFTAPTIERTLHTFTPPTTTTETKGYFFMFACVTRRASLPLVVYAAQGEPPFSYCADRPGLLSLSANRKRGSAQQGKK